MNYSKLQSILPNDEIHYNDSNSFPHVEYVLYENTIDDYYETILILKSNNIASNTIKLYYNTINI